MKEILGDRLLGSSQVDLVIPAYDVGHNAPHLFKTPHHPRLRRDHCVPMWQVGMATSAAPTYFPAFRLDSHERLIDGGVWANNPVMVGVAEAVSMFGRGLSELRVFSVGTTSSAAARASKHDGGGLLQWALRRPNMVDVLLDGQSAGATNQAVHLIGADFVRRLHPVAPTRPELDRCDVRDLIALASHSSRHFIPIFESEFTGSGRLIKAKPSTESEQSDVHDQRQ